MKLFEYSIAWKFSSENWEVGVIMADSREQAEEILKREHPDIISCSVYDTISDLKPGESYCIYSH